MDVLDRVTPRPATVRCPICGKEVPFDGPEMPFCSARCRIVDLGNWASDKYVISRPLEPGELADEESEPRDRSQ